MDLQDIHCQEEKHGESYDCTGPPATETCLELGETRLDQHFPHEFVGKLRLKHVKTQI